MDNPEKLATYGTQEEDKQDKLSMKKIITNQII
jgi:hypothetical protein